MREGDSEGEGGSGREGGREEETGREREGEGKRERESGTGREGGREGGEEAGRKQRKNTPSTFLSNDSGDPYITRRKLQSEALCQLELELQMGPNTTRLATHVQPLPQSRESGQQGSECLLQGAGVHPLTREAGPSQ